MNRNQGGGEIEKTPSPSDGRAEAAALATKLANLPKKVRSAEEASVAARAEHFMTARHSCLWWTCHTFFWLVALSLALIAVLRIVFHDGTNFLTCVNAFTRYVYLPAYACLAWAAWQRRYLLVILSGLIIASHWMWIAPDFLPDRRFTAAGEGDAATTSTNLRIFFSNVYMDNPDLQPLLEEIAEADPDVVVLVEFHPRWHPHFQKSPIMARYKHGADMHGFYRGNVTIYSKQPMLSRSYQVIATRVVQSVEIPLGSQSLRLIGLHAPRPMNVPGYDYRGFWQQVLPMLITEQGPLVVVGDFNATQYSLVCKKLKNAGLRSAHEDRGRGYATTWPNGQLLVPPIRIDQAFLSPHLGCTRIVEGRGIGSDHKPLILDVHLRNSH